MLRFVAINGYGNNFYLDNINVVGAPSELTENETSFLNIYPNPSKGDFFIHHNMNNPTLEIYSIDGKLIYNNKLKELKERINLSLPSGIYHVRLRDNKNLKNQELIIQ